MEPADPKDGTGLEGVSYTLCGENVCPHDPKHVPLPILYDYRTASVVTRWRLTDEERERIAAGADLFIWQMGVDPGRFPPMLPSVPTRCTSRNSGDLVTPFAGICASCRRLADVVVAESNA